MKKILLPLIACALFGAASCESMLDIPQKGVVSYEDFYANDDDAKAALVNMYKQYINNVAATEGIDVPEQVMLNYSADDILAAGGYAEDHAPFRYFCEFRYDNANATLKQVYQRYCYSIYHANLVISNFTNENRNGTEPKWTSAYTEQCVAEARVMRAYLHLMMALSWNVPPILDRVYDPDEVIASSESQSVVLEWVIAECEKAINSGKLPKRASKDDKDNTARMNEGFARFIAGKAAMFNNDPATAKKYLKPLVESSAYALVPSKDFWTLFHIAGDGNSETIFEPNLIEDPSFTSGWGAMMIGRWMVANVFCWRTDALASSPQVHVGNMGWNGGAIQQDFAKRFLEHDGKSPRRLACFLTADEWLYEMDWASDIDPATGQNVNMSLADKKKDPNRGISSANGVYSHGPYFEWKHMVFINPPKILTGGDPYPADNLSTTGPASNQTNFGVARLAEAYLLYAEACLETGDKAEGEKYFHAIQERSGSGKITDLTIQNLIEEKQYELWFEGCRFHDVVRWSQKGYVDLDQIFNKSGIHKDVPIVYDAYFTHGEAEHRLYTKPAAGAEAIISNDFEKGRHEYFPFPYDVTKMNSALVSYGKWGGAAAE